MYRRRTTNWTLVGTLFGVALLAGVALMAALARPSIITLYPAPNALNTATRAPLRITFDRAMNHASVEQALQVTPNVTGTFEWEADTLLFYPAQPWAAESVVVVRLNGGASAQGIPLLGETTWSFTVGRERVAYLRGRPANIWAVSVYTDTKPVQLTNEPYGVNDFSVSFDGAWIYYSAQRADGGADIRALRPDAGTPIDVLLCPGMACFTPVASPNNQWLAYERRTEALDATGSPTYGDGRVYLFNRATQADDMLGDPSHGAHLPRWGADGRLGFYDVTREAIVIQTLGGGVTYIPVTSGEMGTWSPDGRLMVYPEIEFITNTTPVLDDSGVPLFDPTPNFYSHLLQVEIATNLTHNLSGESGVVEDASPVYSPDGVWVAFARRALTTADWTPGRQLWIMRADGSDARKLTDAPLYHHSALAWSPDSAQLTFMRFDATDLAAPPEVWVIPAHGGEAHLVNQGGFSPIWLP